MFIAARPVFATGEETERGAVVERIIDREKRNVPVSMEFLKTRFDLVMNKIEQDDVSKPLKVFFLEMLDAQALPLLKKMKIQRVNEKNIDMVLRSVKVSDLVWIFVKSEMERKPDLKLKVQTGKMSVFELATSTFKKILLDLEDRFSPNPKSPEGQAWQSWGNLDEELLRPVKRALDILRGYMPK